MASRSWQEKYESIKKDFPIVDDFNWSLAMERDPDLFAKILGDVLKAQGRGSTPGKRPSLDRSQAESQLAKIAADDFSEFEFQQAFKALSHGRSLRNISHKTGLAKSYVHRLLLGEALPSFDAMEKIAVGFGKEPSFFLEYRIAYVLLTIDEFLTASPETATGWYLKMKSKSKMRI